MNKTIYIASSQQNKLLLESLMYMIAKNVPKVMFSSSWVHEKCLPLDENLDLHDSNSFEYLKARAVCDYSEIDNSDIIIGVYPYGYGTTSELGYALGANKKVLMLCPSDFLDELPLPMGLALHKDPSCVFTELETLVKKLQDLLC